MHKTSTSNSYIGEYKKNDNLNNNIQEKLLHFDSETFNASKLIRPMVFDVKQEVVDRILNFAKSI